MRIYLKLSRNYRVVPFDYQIKLVGTLHKWLGQNESHDDISLYSHSWLRGGKSILNGLDFPKGADWFISSHDTSLIKRVIAGIIDDPSVEFGMKVLDISIKDTPLFENTQRFFLGSPVFVQQKIGDAKKHFTYLETAADEILTKTLHTKLSKAGLKTEGALVRFDRDYPQAKTKLSSYRNIKNRVNFCPVIVDGTPEQIGFAWDVGIGNSTGIGFGSLL